MTVPHRRAYIDWARGIAVLVMIEAHTTDAWTRPASKHSIAFRDAAVLGGFAAPLFLWLAGLGVVLAANRVAERTGSRTKAVDAACRRGIEIFILAFLFRLQAFVLSPGSHPITLFRVDILNVMGPAMALTGLVWFAVKRPFGRVAAYAAIAAAIAMATPVIRSAPAVNRLPIWLQWYMRPSGEHTTFTLLPWAGFVFAGAAIGSLVAAVRETSAEWRLHASIAIAGGALVAFGFWMAGRPSIYRSASFWTSSPTWFAIRTGILMLVLSATFALERVVILVRGWAGRRGVSGAAAAGGGWSDPLARMGRSSLFIYWIHVEMVYGYASWLWRGTLPLWATWIAFAAFSGLMYAAVVWKDRVVTTWRRITSDPASSSLVRDVRL
jgi:uncharacterized membrane protein